MGEIDGLGVRGSKESNFISGVARDYLSSYSNLGRMIDSPLARIYFRAYFRYPLARIHIPAFLNAASFSDVLWFISCFAFQADLLFGVKK